MNEAKFFASISVNETGFCSLEDFEGLLPNHTACTSLQEGLLVSLLLRQTTTVNRPQNRSQLLLFMGSCRKTKTQQSLGKERILTAFSDKCTFNAQFFSVIAFFDLAHLVCNLKLA